MATRLASLRSPRAGNRLSLAQNRVIVVRPAVLAVDAKRVCELTGQKRNKANKVCFSNKKSRTFQQVNLQRKRVYWEKGQRWVSLRLSAKAMRTIKKKGLDVVAEENGVNLASLPYRDNSDARVQWKAANPAKPPMAKNPRKMKNPEKLAASTKAPRVAVYMYGKIAYVRADEANVM